MDDNGVLPVHKGIIRHDCGKSYWMYKEHTQSVCESFRRTDEIEENYPEKTWVKKFNELLLDFKKVKDKAL